MLSTVVQLAYRFIVEGELTDASASVLPSMTVCRGGGITTLTAAVRDQAELQGILRRLGDMGLTLLSVTAISDTSAQRPAADQDPQWRGLL